MKFARLPATHDDGGLDEFAVLLEGFKRRIAALSHREDGAATSPESGQPGVIAEMIEELLYSSEELSVAYEELRQQTDELVATRHQLEAQSQRYQDLFEFAPDGYVETDSAGTIREANAAVALLLNTSPRFLIGKPLVTFVVADDRRQFREELHRLSTSSARREWRATLRPRGAAPITVSFSVAPMQHAGSPSLRWQLRDVTEQVRTEREIQALNTELARRVGERTAQLQEAVRLQSILLEGERVMRSLAESAQERLAFLAAASERMSGWLDPDSAREGTAALTVPVLADWCVALFANEDGSYFATQAIADDSVIAAKAREMVASYPAVLEPTAPVIYAMQSRRAQLISVEDAPTESGDGFTAALRRAMLSVGFHGMLALPLVARGRTLGALALFARHPDHFREHGRVALAEDFSRRAALAMDNQRLYDVAMRASQAKSAFLGVMSHEFRTPLSSIIGYADLLGGGAYGDLSESQRKPLAHLQGAAQHLLRLVDELLGFARLEAGQESVRLADVEVAPLLDQARSLVEPLARAKGLALHVDAAPCGALCTDPGKLTQVLLNLLTNAVKYTSRGEVRLTASLSDDGAMFEVRDTGRGIAEEDLPHIFDPFWQVHAHRGTAKAGVGLGLSVVKHLTMLLGGSVSVESAVGAGSTFRVFVPSAPSPERPGAG